MSAINNAVHEHFISQIRSAAEDEKIDTQPLIGDLEMLEKVYTDYQYRLYQIRQLIKEYRTHQQKIRINLRRCQVERGRNNAQAKGKLTATLL